MATRTLYNVQVDFYPILSAENFQNQNVSELFSFQTANDSTIGTLYQIDIPQTDIASYVFDTLATEEPSGTILSQAVYSWIAWGLDTDGVAFFSLYHSATSGVLAAPDEIDFLSRSKAGPSNQTRNAVLGNILDLGNDHLSALATAVGNINVDERRPGMLPVSCDGACQANNGTNSL